MAANYTTNYDLCQWEPTDAVQRVEFNADNAKLDAALKALSDQVVQKANQSALNTLVTAVNQKANQTDLTAAVGRISALEGGKADQTALNQAVSTLTAADRLVLLSQATIGAATTAYTLTVPDWSGAWELQLRYNIFGTGNMYLSFNGNAPCYDSETLQILTSIQIKYDTRTCATGVVYLHPCGSTGRLSCYINGTTLDEEGYNSFEVTAFCTLNTVTRRNLTQIKFHSDSGTIQAGGSFAFYCVR